MSDPTPRIRKLLSQEVQPCDDPICSCEAEPRWLRFQQESDDPEECTEWESLDRPPSAEL